MRKQGRTRHKASFKAKVALAGSASLRRSRGGSSMCVITASSSVERESRAGAAKRIVVWPQRRAPRAVRPGAPFEAAEGAPPDLPGYARRRPCAARPTRPAPSSSIVPGSGTTAVIVTVAGMKRPSASLAPELAY